MQFFQANTDDFSRIEKFLLPWEFSCVTLSSYVRKHDEHIYIFAENQNSEEIFGLIYFDRVLLHCFPAFLNEDFSKQKDFEQALQNNDSVMIGDLSEYEICPRLSAISNTLKQI